MIEYKIIKLAKTPDKIQEELNSLARQGWRIVCSCGAKTRHIILKRKVQKVEEEDQYEYE